MDDDDLRLVGLIAMQAYAAKRYGAPAPIRVRWAELAGLLERAGIVLPSDWAAVMSDGAL